MIIAIDNQRQNQLRQQHAGLFNVQRRYLFKRAIAVAAVFFYYLYFFIQFGISLQQLIRGLTQLGHYFLRMFVWHDVASWPFAYYFGQIGITLGIVFAGTFTATLVALPLSFFAARNVMNSPALRPVSVIVRRLLDLLRGIGLVYAENMRLWNWDVVMFITLIMVVIVMVMDALSARLRKRYITGQPVPVFESHR